MNFFHAKLCRDGVYYVELAGKRLELTPEKQRQLMENQVEPQEIILGVRPEHVLLTGEQGYLGVVEVTEMMGSNTHLHVRFGDDEAVILVPDGEEPVHEYQIGESVHFTFLSDHIHLFSKETEQNLERKQDAAQPSEALCEPGL